MSDRCYLFYGVCHVWFVFLLLFATSWFYVVVLVDTIIRLVCFCFELLVFGCLLRLVVCF